MSSKVLLFLNILLMPVTLLFGQDMKIKGFIDFNANYHDKKSAMALGEEDLFITSDLNERTSFLGETVFKYASESSTSFTLGLERAIIKYNFYGNHNLVIGKHHTPINYWNDTYHHGRVFFPTIFRPAMFGADIIPLHTTGIGVQGHDLGGLRFGYNLLIGNGIGSNEISDNNSYKSITAAVHIKPIDDMQLGASIYRDIISAGGNLHNGTAISHQVNQLLSSVSIGYFKRKIELLAEGTFSNDHTDTLGNAASSAYYVYAGIRFYDRLVLYGRLDQINFSEKEMYFTKNDLTSIVGGIRLELNYLMVIKLEYQNTDNDINGNSNSVNLQFAIGF